MKLLDEIRQDVELFHSDNHSYQAKVKRISTLLQSEFMSDFLPTYLVGDYGAKGKIVLLGMNPGFNAEQNKIEESQKNQSWDRYERFMKSFFAFFKRQKLNSPYYTKLGHLFSGIEGKSPFTHGELYDYCQQNVVSMDLVPYHSTHFNKPNGLTHEQSKYLFGRLEQIMYFLDEIHPRLAIFNGGLYSDLLRGSRFMKRADSHKVAKVTMYCFRYGETPCVLFSMMVTSPWSGVTHIHMESDIPGIIRGCFVSVR